METTKNNTSTKPQLNARGGIDRQSSRESSGLVSSGSTGSGSQLMQPVITAEALAPTPTPVLAPEKTPVQTASMLGNLQSATDSYTQGLKDKAATDDVGRATALDAYLNAQKSARGVTSMQNDAYAVSGGVNDITPELNDINDRIRQEQRGLDLAKRAVTEKGGGLKSGAAAELSNLERVSLQKQADLSIIQMAVQGRYDSAKEIADRAVSARFEQQQNDLDVARFNYTENKDLFTKSEQRAFESEQADRERKLTEERENANAIYDLGIKAQQDGAPAGVVERMLAAKTKQEAAAIGGSYIGALDREAKRSQLYTNSLQQQKLLAELNPTNDVADGDLVAYAQQFADSGKLPSVSELKQSGLSISQVTEYAKQSPKQDGAILSSSTGIKSSSLSPAQEDGIAALYDIRKKTAELKLLDEERQKGLTSAVIGKTFGSQDQQKYVDLRQEIVDLLARARTGAALTASEEKFYADQLPGRVGQLGVIPGTGMGLFGANTQDKLNNFESKIEGTLQTRLNATGSVIQGYSKVKVPVLGEKTVGEIVDIGGTQYRVLPDGTLTDII